MVYPPDIYKSVISVFLKKFLKKMALWAVVVDYLK
jgi:hypothetical protein